MLESVPEEILKGSEDEWSRDMPMDFVTLGRTVTTLSLAVLAALSESAIWAEKERESTMMMLPGYRLEPLRLEEWLWYDHHSHCKLGCCGKPQTSWPTDELRKPLFLAIFATNSYRLFHDVTRVYHQTRVYHRSAMCRKTACRRKLGWCRKAQTGGPINHEMNQAFPWSFGVNN
jgi:hypothetical protein